MKKNKNILLLTTFLGLLFSTNLYAVTVQNLKIITTPLEDGTFEKGKKIDFTYEMSFTKNSTDRVNTYKVVIGKNILKQTNNKTTSSSLTRYTGSFTPDTYGFFNIEAIGSEKICTVNWVKINEKRQEDCSQQNDFKMINFTVKEPEQIIAPEPTPEPEPIPEIIEEEGVDVTKQVLNCTPEPLEGEEVETEVKVIDNSNITSLNEDFTLEGENTSGTPIEFDYYTNGNGISGFGIAGKDKKSGNPSETGEGEEIIFTFEKNIKEIEISFSWLQTDSWVTMEFYKDDVLVGKPIKQYGIGSTGPNNINHVVDVSDYVKNKKGVMVVNSIYNGINYGSDLIDPLRTYKPTLPDVEFNKIRIYNEENSKGRNDWLINTISYKVPKEQPTPQILGDLLYSEPMIVAKPEGGAYVYDSTFEIGNINTMKSGRITKKTIGYDNSIVTLWDTNDYQAITNIDERKIYTTHDRLGSLVEFKSTRDNQTLKEIIFPRYSDTTFFDNKTSDILIESFISWYRGKDILDENRNDNFTENRSLLGDVYNSNVIYLNTPNEYISTEKNRYESYYRYKEGYKAFIEAQKNRENIVIASSNDGMIHAFSDTEGKEKWAYIPPFNLQKIGSMVVPWMVSNSETKIMNYISNSIFAMDGKSYVKDVKINGEWKTILIATAGRNDSAFTVLDITNPSIPSHLFSVYYDKTKDESYHWDKDGKLTLGSSNSSFDFRNLGNVFNKPNIVLLPNGAKENPNFNWKIVLGSGVEAKKSGVFVLDINENGKIEKFFDISNLSINGAPELSIASELSAISPDTTNKIYGITGAIFYFADTQGTLWRLPLVDVNSWKTTSNNILTRLFTNNSSVSIDRSNFTKVIPYLQIDKETSDVGLWLTYGTGNVFKIDEYNPNIENLIVNFRDKDFYTYNTSGTQEQLYMDLKIGNLEASKNVSDLTQLNYNDVETKDTQTRNISSYGWYLKLEPSERIYSDMLVSNNTLYGLAFKPNPLDICGVGSTSLYAMSAVNAFGEFEVDEAYLKRISISGKVSNLKTLRDSLILTGNISEIPNDDFVQVGNILIGDNPSSIVKKPIDILYKKENN